MGAGSGSALYYACDAYMLRDFGRAQKRATEVRDELIGVVVSQVPVNEVKEKITSTVVSPLANAKETLKNSWNSGVSNVFSSVGGAPKEAAKEVPKEAPKPDAPPQDTPKQEETS